jgi:SAM-dependent methyltransferase
MVKMAEWNIESWLTDSTLDEIEYSNYWNNEEQEKNKEWYILDGNFSKMEHLLQKTGLPRDLMQCVDCLKVDFNRELEGVGIDLAAGNLWAAPYLFNLGKIDKLYCLEYSKHRLLKIGPKVLEQYKVSKDKIFLVYGSFYDLHLKDNSLNFVFLSQAFHHADDPDRLLSEVYRVLKPRGVVIIIGEHKISYLKAYLKHAIRIVISLLIPLRIQQKLFGKTFKIKKLISRPWQLFPSDPVLGDHYYSDDEYRAMFSKYRFKMKHIGNPNSQFQSFVLVSRDI